MKQIPIAVALAILCVGCGEKAGEVKESANALSQLASAGANIESTANEAQKFMADRKAKGDTVAMPYKDLQVYLPSISGYTSDGGPKGQSMNMGMFSMSTAEQNYMSGTDPDAKRIHVSIADYSGSEAGYGMMMPFMAMNISSEDDHQRGGSVKLDVPTTFAFGEFNKDSKDSKVTAGTRYRYFITIEATSQKDDVTKELARIVSDIAKKLANK